MNLINLFDNLVKVSSQYCSIENIHTEDINECEWKNLKLNVDQIRYGHLEYFKGNNNKVEVVHLTCYPKLGIDFPIFGFDVISLNNKITGIFCDVTPAISDNEELRNILQLLSNKYSAFNRTLPAWAEFFSKDFLALSPRGNEQDIFNDCINLFLNYLDIITTSKLSDDKNLFLMQKQSQNNYSLYQQKNTKTLKALSSYIGIEKATEFINKTLFPVVE